jgi:multidrug transporter EmrE-like cation transporter
MVWTRTDVVLALAAPAIVGVIYTIGDIGMHWLALFVAVLANATANVAFKKTMTNASFETTFFNLLKLAADPWMWVGSVSAALLLGSYLYALKGLDLSVAYPAVTGLAMLAIAFAGATFLDEAMSVWKLVAIILITIGVIMLRFSP